MLKNVQKVALSFTVDSNLTIGQNPPLTAIDGSNKDRPVAYIKDEDGIVAEFVENELLVTTNDTGALNALLKRWGGKLVKTIEMKSQGLSDLANLHLVQIDTTTADVDKLKSDLETLDKNAQGEYIVSSDAALGLFAIGAHEQVSGMSIGLNWVGNGSDIASGHTRDEAGGNGFGHFSDNAFEWHFMTAGSTQDIGVTEAWKMLDEQGKMEKWIKLAILDMGFVPSTNGDIDSDYQAISNVPGKSAINSSNILGCGSGNPCPWHGTSVANSAMGLLDNNRGGAGPAGGVAKPVLIFTLYDFFSGIGAVLEAKAAGAKIINMSYGAPVPSILAWSVLPFNEVTKRVRQTGVLLFAAAGNDNRNVDGKRCFIGICWEKTWYTPCENAGVTCVGGLDADSQNRADYGGRRGSNYGHENVDMYAPFMMLVGRDPSADHPAGASYYVSGTSFSSPYTAGVAALIWSANHELSANQVWDIMKRTAHTSPDDTVDRYVNAQAAVREAMGTSINITAPAEGTSIIRGRLLTFSAAVASTTHSAPVITWQSDIHGALGEGATISYRDLEVGTHLITAKVTYSDGFTKTDEIHVTITNLVPEVFIDQPLDGAHFAQSANILLNGRSFDGDAAPDFHLTDSQVSWSLNGIPLGTGHSATAFSATSIGLAVGGPYDLSFVGTDGVATVSKHIAITIDADPADLPPNVEIRSPVHNTTVMADQQEAGKWYKSFALTWRAVDPEDGVLPYSSLVWTESINGGAEQPLTVTPFVLTLPGNLGNTITSYGIKLFAEGNFSTVHEIILRATDSAGNTSTHKVKVTVDVLS